MFRGSAGFATTVVIDWAWWVDLGHPPNAR